MGPDALLIYNPEIEYKTLHHCNKFWKRYLHLTEKKNYSFTSYPYGCIYTCRR